MGQYSRMSLLEGDSGEEEDRIAGEGDRVGGGLVGERQVDRWSRKHSTGGGPAPKNKPTVLRARATVKDQPTTTTTTNSYRRLP